MVDVASMLDLGSAAGLHDGKVDVKGVGNTAKHPGLFFAVLASRLDPAGNPGSKYAALMESGGKLGPLDAGLASQALELNRTAPELDSEFSAQSLSTEIAQQQAVDHSSSGITDGAVNPFVIIGQPAMPLQHASALSADNVQTMVDGSGDPLSALSGRASGESKIVSMRPLHANPPSKSPAEFAGIADGEGQLLPARDVHSADGELASLQTSGLHNDAAAGASPTMPANAGVNAFPDIQGPRSFEQTLRQAERLHIPVDAPVRTAAFPSEFGEKVVWLAGRQGQLAELSLNPPQLGSLEVRLSVSGGEAGAQFFSPNPVVRDAIEAALPRLREMMAQAGINLGEAHVRDEAFTQGKGLGSQAQDPSGLSGGTDAQREPLNIGMIRSGGLGLVDLYV